MSTLKYLPVKSEYCDKVAAILDSYAEDLYLVGSAARKYLYNLKSITPEDYDFVFDTSEATESQDNLTKDFESLFTGKVSRTNWGLEIDAEVLTVKIKFEPIGKYLRSVRFAGDGLAISCADDRPIVIPEYMSLPPVVAILKTDETSDQNNVEWVNDHLLKLQKFQEELFNVVNSKLDESEKR